MKITKRIVTTKEVEACRRCEQQEAEWLVGVSLQRMDSEEQDVTDCGTQPEPFCTACRNIIVSSLRLKRRPRKGKEGEPV